MRATKLQDYVLANMVPGVAAQMAARLPSADREDLEQEMSLWVLAHPRQLAEWFGDGQDFRGERMTAVALRNEARDYAREQCRQAGLSFDEDEEEDDER